MKEIKENKGITLIALVITIIILIILAAVSIATLSGNNGTLTKTTEAVVRQAIGTAQDKCTLAAADVLTDYYYDVYVDTLTDTAYSANDLDDLIIAAITESTADNSCYDEILALGIEPESTGSTGKAAFQLTYSDGSYITATVSNGKITWGTLTIQSTSNS